jgi:hypothetical protein
LRQEECGKALDALLVPAGSMLLPLLACNEDIELQELTMDCLKSILKINYDVLWRPLFELSGIGIPPHPLSIHLHTQRAAQVSEQLLPPVTSNERGHMFATRSHELLAYIHTLPEQSLF